MGKISPLAVLAGALIDLGTTTTSSFVIMLCVAITHRHQRVLDTMHTTPVRTLEFVIGFACSILGAYIAGVLAKRAQILNGFLSVAVPALLSWLVYLLRRTSSLPALWIVLSIIATPITGVLGGWLALLQARGRELAA